MEAKLLDRNYVNSDLGVVNAARVSLAKQSEMKVINEGYGVYETLHEADTKLISYLAKHNHWTPFSHASAIFEFSWAKETALDFYHNYNPGGFSIEYCAKAASYLIKGSLYSWANAIKANCFTDATSDYIIEVLYATYPVAIENLLETGEIEPSFPFYTYCLSIEELFLENCKVLYNKWKILPATLLLRVPIFVARQIRTSQVGFAYSDLYVENEAFSFNEVSRRYVSDEPEFYKFTQFRGKPTGGVKQGSSGIVEVCYEDSGEDKPYSYPPSSVQEGNIRDCTWSYNNLIINGIAPEQARALLPQSMYTEFWMTATLHRWAQFIQLRSTPHVQEETREIVESIKVQLCNRYPSWASEYNF